MTHRHLAALTDAQWGISEFAKGTEPQRERFCIEDTARALVAVLKIHALAPTDDRARLARGYLDAIGGLQRHDGRVYFGYDRDGKPLEKLATGDQVGRTLWGLGHAGIHGVDDAMRLRAQGMFTKLLPYLDRKAPGTVQQSYGIQGLHLFLKARPDAAVAARALRDVAGHLLSKLPGDPGASWQWPDEVITYDSARFPLALLLAFETTGDTRYREAGIRTLNFLSGINLPKDGTTFHAIGNRGWCRRGRPPARFDQQPIDVSSFVEASVAARRITHDESWKIRARTAFSWFAGNNAVDIAVYDAESGGCRDGIGPRRVNQNQGAESTVSFWIARCEIETLDTPQPNARSRSPDAAGDDR